MDRAEILVVRAGLFTSVQDAGRPGMAHLGIAPSGALDPLSRRLANQLVGNPEDAAVLETTLTGVAVQTRCECTVAVTGAQAPVAVDGRAAVLGIPQPLRAGQTLDVGRSIAGVRSYIAVSGGFAVPPVFGSRATDVLSGLGPPRLADGDVLPVGPRPQSAPAADFEMVRLPPDTLHLTVYAGPRDDWLAEAGLNAFSSQTWTVATASNRVGLRLDGTSLERARTGELPSEGVVSGAIQIPPDGRPVILLADHPTTGGYPVVGVVAASDLPACAQARPGMPVRLHMRPSPWWPLASVPNSAAEDRPIPGAPGSGR